MPCNKNPDGIGNRAPDRQPERRRRYRSRWPIGIGLSYANDAHTSCYEFMGRV
jgi:hypothetical protein